MDDFFGDPLLFKVTKKMKDGVDSGMVYEVEDFFVGPSLMDIWLNPFHFAYVLLSVCLDYYVCLVIDFN